MDIGFLALWRCGGGVADICEIDLDATGCTDVVPDKILTVECDVRDGVDDAHLVDELDERRLFFRDVAYYLEADRTRAVRIDRSG